MNRNISALALLPLLSFAVDREDARIVKALSQGDYLGYQWHCACLDVLISRECHLRQQVRHLEVCLAL